MQFVADHHFNVGFDDFTLVKQLIKCNIIRSEERRVGKECW